MCNQQNSLTCWHLKQFYLFIFNLMEDEMSMTTFYYYSVNHQSSLQRNTFSKSSYIFLKKPKGAANYVISFEVYDGFIGQKILKLWRHESWPFGPGWTANITAIRLWTFRLPCLTFPRVWKIELLPGAAE